MESKKIKCVLAECGIGVENAGHVKLCNASIDVFKDSKGNPVKGGGGNVTWSGGSKSGFDPLAAKKAREIYYDKKSKKSIYGTATPEEREELEDEGINLVSVPWVDKDN